MDTVMFLNNVQFTWLKPCLNHLQQLLNHYHVPYFTCKILDEVSKARFHSISFDASNKGNTKTYPFVIQYLSDVGVKRGLIDFLEDSHEAALDIFKNIIKVIDDHQLNIYNLTSIGTVLKDRLPHILKGNCYAHVLHNGVKHAHDILKCE
ncbi:unnamed protein product [Rotaria magnacalcarata]|uniref:DUF659 domain-containing protein n=1 Tax=Rotaria magnacalcarata TaxID=392030 RepID=A0A814XG63_9BILA|nr:unnamed protein product [Rotaria magnacalcarata]CAF3838399.1 unnamed protein product [Rotaria magnacalcarata]CAF4129838.1 unnamed protein product [Rotaria magnacalcarata]